MKDNTIFKTLMDKELAYGVGAGEGKAIAFAVATARRYATGDIMRISVEGSPLLAIGAQTTIIPHADGQRGALLPAALGALVGNATAGMGVIDAITEADVQAASQLIDDGRVTLTMDAAAPDVYLKVRLVTDQHTATVILYDSYAGVKYIELDGNIIQDTRDLSVKPLQDISELSVERIYDYCKNCPIEELERFKYLMELTGAISEDGLQHPYGLEVGRTLHEEVVKGTDTDDETNHILMWTVAGIDARMNGSACPSVGNTGSASQGHIITAAPMACGSYRNMDEDTIIRAVALANLLNIYLDYLTKEYAHLSPMCYCGSVGVAAAVGGVAYLHSFTAAQIEELLRTVVGTLPGIICDGASKPICALRVYTGLSGALHTLSIIEKGISIKGYEGIANDSLEVTMDNIYRLQKDCMPHLNDFLFEIKKEQGNIC